MASGIKDRVAIIGMGCSRFGERWDAGSADLMVEAFNEALADAGIGRSQIEAAWFGSAAVRANISNSAIPASNALRLPGIPFTRVENFCATGTEAIRGAVYAVAAGAVDIALAIGVEKLKDTGYGGLPTNSRGTFNDLWLPNFAAPAGFAQVGSSYTAKHGLQKEDVKRAMAHVSWKSHRNGVKSPKAHLRKEVSMEAILQSPLIAGQVGVFDCCGVSDGAAAAIVTTPEIARALGKKDLVTVKAMQLSVSHGAEMSTNDWDGSSIETTRTAARKAYAEAGIKDPRHDVNLLEVHDCFSITELLTMEDLGMSDEGRAVFDIMDGAFDADGRNPCQIDGGLKCFGHPIGASGIRMAYEIYNQLLGRADARQRDDARFGLTHNLGGYPTNCVAGVAIYGRLGD